MNLLQKYAGICLGHLQKQEEIFKRIFQTLVEPSTAKCMALSKLSRQSSNFTFGSRTTQHLTDFGLKIFKGLENFRVFQFRNILSLVRMRFFLSHRFARMKS